MIEPGSVSRIVSTTLSCACIAGDSSLRAAFRAACARLAPSARRLQRLAGKRGKQRMQRIAAIGLDRDRRLVARQLLGVDVDADKVFGQDETAIAIHVVVGRPELGACGDDQIGLVHQLCVRPSGSGLRARQADGHAAGRAHWR